MNDPLLRRQEQVTALVTKWKMNPPRHSPPRPCLNNERQNFVEMFLATLEEAFIHSFQHYRGRFWVAPPPRCSFAERGRCRAGEILKGDGKVITSSLEQHPNCCRTILMLTSRCPCTHFIGGESRVRSLLHFRSFWARICAFFWFRWQCKLMIISSHWKFLTHSSFLVPAQRSQSGVF